MGTVFCAYLSVILAGVDPHGLGLAGAREAALAVEIERPAVGHEHLLVKARVRPYYLYQCDLAEGLEHFRTPVSAGVGVIEYLRGHTSGYAVPTFVVDAPGGCGKIPVAPNYLLSQSPSQVVLRNYEGRVVAYPEPAPAPGHVAANCRYCQQAGPAGGVAGLLQEEAPREGAAVLTPPA